MRVHCAVISVYLKNQLHTTVSRTTDYELCALLQTDEKENTHRQTNTTTNTDKAQTLPVMANINQPIVIIWCDNMNCTSARLLFFHFSFDFEIARTHVQTFITSHTTELSFSSKMEVVQCAIEMIEVQKNNNNG